MRAAAALCLVVVDGLGRREMMGAMPRLAQRVQRSGGRWQRSRAACPSLSLPNYASLVTGLDPAVHGVRGNHPRRRLQHRTLFDTLRDARRRVAVSAFRWWEELCPGPAGPRPPGRQPAGTAPLGAAFLYEAEDTADATVYGHAAALAAQERPDLLLVHPMGVDWAGHRFGAGSAEHAAAVSRTDDLLDAFLDQWTAPGGSARPVIVTADHGMDTAGRHGGDQPAHVDIGLALLGLPATLAPAVDQEVWPQTAVLGVVLAALGLERPGAAITRPSPG